MLARAERAGGHLPRFINRCEPLARDLSEAGHGRLAKYRDAAATQLVNTSRASMPRALLSVGIKTGYPPLWTAPRIAEV